MSATRCARAMRPERLGLGVGRVQREHVRTDHAGSPGAWASSFSIAATAAAARREAERRPYNRAHMDVRTSVRSQARSSGNFCVVEDDHGPAVRREGRFQVFHTIRGAASGSTVP